VYAAASLTDAFLEIGQQFETAFPGAGVSFNFAGSQQLAVQLAEGAQGDVFASADQRNMGRVVSVGLVVAGAPVTFASNGLVVILPADNPAQLQNLEDLARPGVKLILGGEQVPVGAYTRQVLERMVADPVYGPTFREAVLRNVISNEENVKQVVAKVQLGEADAGVVYGSDVTPSLTGKLQQISIPDVFNIQAVYPIAVLSSAAHPDLARDFVDFVLAPEGQRVLEDWGFQRAKP
jgi:molybdate transport system substrate-binding protein